MTETAAIVDVVVPVAQWGEKTGCFTNVDRTAHLSTKPLILQAKQKGFRDLYGIRKTSGFQR